MRCPALPYHSRTGQRTGPGSKPHGPHAPAARLGAELSGTAGLVPEFIGTAGLVPEHIGTAGLAPEFISTGRLVPEHIGTAGLAPEFVGTVPLRLTTALGIACHSGLLGAAR